MSWEWPEIGLAAFLALFLAGMGLCIAYEVRHPCVRYAEERRTCSSTYCAFKDPSTGACTYWATEPYDCTACAERAR